MRSFVNVLTNLLDPIAKKERPAVRIIHTIVVTAECVTPTCAHVSADTLVIFVSCKLRQVCHGIVKTTYLSL